MKLSCIIVDDESMARKSLEKLCRKLDLLDVKGVLSSGTDALEILDSEEIDLIFLDIHMPDLNGIDIVKNIKNLPQIIFITSDKGYALEAFEYNVTDYLIKPFTLPRLLQAVKKASQLKQKEEKEEKSDSSSSHFFIKVDGRYVKLFFEEVLWVESFGDYIQFFTQEKRYTVHMTLKKVEERLPSEKFLRVHRQYIVNLDKIVDIQDNSILIKDKVIPISRSHKDSLMQKLNLL
jgi:DNA-binding LytR/AlgR family response regulator